MFDRIAVFLAACLAFAGVAANAATLNEADMAGGAFGAAWNAPTAVGAGIDRITGTGGQNQYDNFVFTLPAGAQRLSFDFAAPAGAGQSYSAGGEILYSATPFRWGWDGARVATPIQVDYDKPQQSLALDLATDFVGTLYLALNFTHGADLSYTISAPRNAPAPVPLPAGLVLMGTAAAALGAVRLARRGRTTPAA